MDFKRYLKKVAKKLDSEVIRILEEESKRAERTDKKLLPLVSVFAKACRGGKRIRGFLVVLGYELGKHPGQDFNNSSIFKIGSAYEILHTGVLAHDDIIDQSLIRREAPSLYKALGGNQYGISQALSLGDFSFFLAVKIISESSFLLQSKIDALKEFSKVMMDTAWGEMLDLEETDQDVIMMLKTARYTFCGPLTIGAILAGADRKLIKNLDEFGVNLGIAYQIKDDILDTEVKGGVDEAEAKAKNHIIKALKILPKITKEERLSKILQQLAEYILIRKK